MIDRNYFVGTREYLTYFLGHPHPSTYPENPQNILKVNVKYK